MKKKKQKKYLIISCAILLFLIILFGAISLYHHTSTIALYQDKEALLGDMVFTDETIMGKPSAVTTKDGSSQFIVFFSISNGQERATVLTGTGATLNDAWDNADAKTLAFVQKNQYQAYWLKADIVIREQLLTYSDFTAMVSDYRNEFFRWGVSVDLNYNNALLEAELNGYKIIDYDNNNIKMSYLNKYLSLNGREEVDYLPDTLKVFQCSSWICDENEAVYKLYDDGLNYGRRIVDVVDRDCVEDVVINASSFLMEQVNEDGSFVYGFYPRFGNEIDNYNIVRHAAAIWSLICQYRMTGNKDLIIKIDSAIEYMINNAILYADENTAYLWEEKSNEIKLGGCGLAVIALDEYMSAFNSDKYKDLAVALGNGILTMLDQNTGVYYHVLNGDFTRKEEFRTVYYDGEATFALARLYNLTGDEKWLDAAVSAVENFIEEDYTQYKDHWVAYAMNEVTKYVPDERYYTFALKNAQENLDTIYERETTYHTYLELLMVTFELYDRMIEEGIHVDYLDDGFDFDYFLKTIYCRADRMLNGYFYPEYAMYMADPSQIVYTFMVRHDGYRVRIDDVQHNVGGYYLYYKYYDKLVAYGMMDSTNE